MHLNNKRILVTNLYFSEEDKELTERLRLKEVKNRPVIDKTCDNLETENKLVIFYFISEETSVIRSYSNIVIY